MALTATTKRKNAVAHLKRGLILDAARRVFEAEGLEGASLRTIAAESGYTPAALYFHFDSKEALYAELLAQSLAALKGRVDEAIARARTPAARLQAAALAFFEIRVISTSVSICFAAACARTASAGSATTPSTQLWRQASRPSPTRQSNSARRVCARSY